MADTSATFKPADIATSSDAASDALSRIDIALSDASDALSAASNALSKAAAASSTIATHSAAWAAGGGGAPTDAKYIVQELHADLSAEQSLGALTTGLLLNTVTDTTGVLSKATAGVDYEAPHGFFNPDVFPASPTSQSDHFDDASLNVKWTEFDPGSKLTVTEANHCAKLALTSNAATWSGIFQALPAGNFTITAKFRYELNSTASGKYLCFGILLFADATNNPTTTDIVSFGCYNLCTAGTFADQITFYTDYDSYSSTPFGGGAITLALPGTAYFRIRRNETTWYFDTSYDGLSWKYWVTLAQGTYFTPAEFGIGGWQDTGAAQNVYCDWIYYQASDNFVPLGA